MATWEVPIPGMPHSGSTSGVEGFWGFGVWGYRFKVFGWVSAKVHDVAGESRLREESIVW